MSKVLQNKKQLLVFLFAMLLNALGMRANPVDMNAAREVAVKFVNANTKVPLRGTDELQLLTTYKTESDDAAFHIFNTPNGFVIVSADDCATPILGYSNEGQFDMDNIPIQLQDYLQGFVEQIQCGIENHLEADEQTSQQWELVRTTGQLLANNRSVQTVEPMITTIWDQKEPYYNALCPGNSVTGCVATAMAQIMRYWSYPEHGTGSHSYAPESHPEYGTLYADFGATTYDWDNMPDYLAYNSNSLQVDAVARLMYHCGVGVDMDYAPGGSGASNNSIRPALLNYFGYSDEMSREYRMSYTDASWKAKLKDCLNLGRPVYYSGVSNAGTGHAFVCDGYEQNGLFHFNFGWSGTYNGYYAIGAISLTDINQYNSDNQAIFNIHPQGDTTNYVINVSTNNTDGGSVSGGGNFTHGANVTLSAEANSGYDFCYWEENGGITSTNPNYSFTANFNRDLVAIFAEPFTITVSATEGGTAIGGGLYSYGESCTVVAIPDEGYIFANWTKDGNVMSVNANYTFVVTGENNLVAQFVSLDGNIVFADANVKAICVANWDTNSDGELSYVEAAIVTSIGEVFRNNSGIISFKELQYFINLTSIGNNAFRGCSGLTSLAIPNSITSIGDYAFYGCSGLTTLTIPYSVTSIGQRAFQGCSNIYSIASFAETPPTIGFRAFGSLSSNTVVYVPCGFEGAYASLSWGGFSNFYGMCGGTVTVTANSEEYGAVAGGGTFEAGQTCTVTATAVEGYVFIKWTLNGIRVSNSTEYTFYVTGDTTLVAHFVPIGNIIFADANVKAICVANWDTNGDGELSYAEAAMVTSLGQVFRGNTGITSFEELQYFISLASISNNAFNGCNGFIGSLIIPNSVTSIGANAFYGCIGFTGNLIIPNSVISIGSYAFYGCSGLTSMTILADNPPTLGSVVFGNVNKSIPVYVPCGSMWAYQNAEGWNEFTNYMPGTACDSGEITVTTNPMESGTVIGEGYYEGGAICTLTATANIGYIFVNWTENSTVVCNDATYSFTVSGDRDLVANFAEEGSMCNIVFDLYDSYGDGWNGNYLVIDYGDGNQEQLTLESGSSTSYVREVATESHITLTWISGSYIGECSFDVKFGNDVLIYHGSSLSSSFQQELNINCAVATAPHVITAVADPEEGGTVEGAGTYDGGTSLTLTATPNDGYTFCFWSEKGQQVSTNASYSFIVSSDRNLVARFSLPLTVSVTTNMASGGTVIGAGVFDYGNTCTLTATPNEGYLFLNWNKNGVVVSCKATYSFSVTKDTDLEAVFMRLEGTIIGQGEATNSYLPSYSYYRYTLSQQIYTPDEIGAAGSITTISYFNAGVVTKTRSYDIYMVHTDKSTFANTRDWITVTEADRVYSGSVIMSQGYWTTIILDTPFAYDGASNLAVIVDDNTGTWSSGLACRVFNADGNQTIYDYSDSPNYDPINPSSYSGTLMNVKNQIILGITPSTVEQTIVLSQGWNWFSSNVEITLDDLENALVEALPSTTVTIKSQTQNIKYQNGRWTGSLTTLDKTRMYMISVENDCEITLEGVPIDPSNLTVTIDNGANWLAFPYDASMTVSDFFCSFPVNNDMVKSQSQNARYQGNRWGGQLGTLVPGQGYIYISADENVRTFTFPASSR